jgi:hypothetical protein
MHALFWAPLGSDHTHFGIIARVGGLRFPGDRMPYDDPDLKQRAKIRIGGQARLEPRQLFRTLVSVPSVPAPVRRTTP